MALQLTGEFEIQAKKIVCLDTKFRPSSSFYRNLMAPAHMQTMGPDVLRMLENSIETALAIRGILPLP